MAKSKSLKSMTGYAVVEKQFGKTTYKVHLKTVNHRFTELRCRMPRPWLSFEVEARSFLQKNLERGSFDLWVEESHESPSDNSQKKVQSFFKKLTAAVDEVKGISQISLPSPIRALILARYPDYWLSETSNKESESISLEEFSSILESLVKTVDDVRSREGAAIQTALLGYARDMNKARQLVEVAYPDLRKDWEKNYRDRLLKVADDLKISAIPEERIMQEMLVLAEKRDVAEELQRLQGHLGNLENLLKDPSGDQIGKRLEFLLQELHREWTTLGNKIQNLEVAQHIVEAKLSLEKIREQTLNLV